MELGSAPTLESLVVGRHANIQLRIWELPQRKRHDGRRWRLPGRFRRRRTRWDGQSSRCRILSWRTSSTTTTAISWSWWRSSSRRRSSRRKRNRNGDGTRITVDRGISRRRRRRERQDTDGNGAGVARYGVGRDSWNRRRRSSSRRGILNWSYGCRVGISSDGRRRRRSGRWREFQGGDGSGAGLVPAWRRRRRKGGRWRRRRGTLLNCLFKSLALQYFIKKENKRSHVEKTSKNSETLYQSTICKFVTQDVCSSTLTV